MKMAIITTNSIFLFIGVHVYLHVTDAGFITRIKDESSSKREKRFEDINTQFTEFRKELHYLRTTVESQEILIQEQRRLIRDLKESYDKNRSVKVQEALLGQENEDKAKTDGSTLGSYYGNPEHDPTNNGEINSNNTQSSYTNSSTNQALSKEQKHTTDAKAKYDYIPLKPEEIFGQSLRYRRTIAENVAFSSYLDHEMKNIPLGTMVVCNRILMNDGDGYNSNTGVFTAHVPGVYYFSYSIDSKVIHAHVRLLLDGTNLVDAIAQVNTMGSNTAIVRLERGQSVWIETFYVNNTELISTSTFRMVTFSGFLIYQN